MLKEIRFFPRSADGVPAAAEDITVGPARKEQAQRRPQRHRWLGGMGGEGYTRCSAQGYVELCFCFLLFSLSMCTTLLLKGLGATEVWWDKACLNIKRRDGVCSCVPPKSCHLLKSADLFFSLFLFGKLSMDRRKMTCFYSRFFSCDMLIKMYDIETLLWNTFSQTSSFIEIKRTIHYDFLCNILEYDH